MSFNFNFTKEQLGKIFPNNKNIDELFAALSSELPKYDITSVERVAGFLAQCGHESAGFTVKKENLNYSADGLLKVFPKYFKTQADANAYARQPAKIANRVYGNRMGNGPESSGEGFKFCGRGYIQLTGKSNYSAFAKSINKSLDEAIAYLETINGAVESACWFWKTNNINRFCDANDIVGMTKAINGGTNGLQDRTDYFVKAKSIIQSGSGLSTVKSTVTPPAPPAPPEDPFNQVLLQIGSKGEEVKQAQLKLGLPADGSYGQKTEVAVKRFQEANGLTITGRIDAKTAMKLFA